jgi:hypothetical protein
MRRKQDYNTYVELFSKVAPSGYTKTKGCWDSPVNSERLQRSVRWSLSWNLSFKEARQENAPDSTNRRARGGATPICKKSTSILQRPGFVDPEVPMQV